jgi:hypothetical protein
MESVIFYGPAIFASVWLSTNYKERAVKRNESALSSLVKLISLNSVVWYAAFVFMLLAIEIKNPPKTWHYFMPLAVGVGWALVYQWEIYKGKLDREFQ